MKIGVYGLGRFGSFWAKSLASAGFETIAYSRSVHLLPPGVVRASEEEVLHADFVFFCVAISSFESVLKSVGSRIGKDSIVMDTCSVKTYPARWMMENIGEDIYKIATHPMFGPDSGKNGLKNLPIVMCPISERDERYEKVKTVFEKMDLKVIEMTVKEHDKEAAFSQGITHLVGRTLSEMKLKPSDIATQGYKSLLTIMDQTCNDPLQLFYDLQRYNPYTIDMRHALKVALEETAYKLENGVNEL
ncbi:MAG: prephenate dehydrogenase/arogenate dehydrogenase family protein [Spirochaetales bacterium]|nr:prephenate dehydrogenase/arogenate dehydrogenase family protein [Candidatus Physcosoma equi]